MSNPEIVDETPMSMFEMKEELAKIKKRDKELNFRANKVEEYLNQFVTIKQKEFKEMVDKINKLNVPRLKEQHIFKIMDIMPQTVDELKTILQGYTITVNNDNLKKIVNIVAHDGKKA
jgi:DNA-directed RNA polymerase subunit F